MKRCSNRPGQWFFAGVLRCGTMLLALTFLLPAGNVFAARRPNFLFILADNLGQDWFGCYGAAASWTPRIDKLAANGVRFEHCYVTPLCSTTRAQLLTGRYGYRTGWHTHHDAAIYGGGGFDWQREITWARVLRSAGYATAIAGKWQINDLYEQRDALRQHGFDDHLVWTGALVGEGNAEQRWKASIAPGGKREMESRYHDPIVFRNGERAQLTGKFGPDVFVDYLVEFMTRHRDQPFVAYYACPLVHTPTVPTPLSPDKNASEREQFTGMVRYLDRQVGRLEQELVRHGLRENTIIIFLTDNGTPARLSGTVGDKKVAGGLGTLNENGLDVPLIVNCPARVAQGRVSKALVDCSDFFPTILELAGVEVPRGLVIDGHSFAAQLDPRAAPPAGRDWIFSQYAGTRVIRDHRFKLYSTGPLFDVAADPLEQIDLADSPESAAVAVRRRLQRALAQLPADTNLPFPYRSSSAFQLEAGRGAGGRAGRPTVAGQYFELTYPRSTEPGALQIDVTYTLWIPGGAKQLRAVIVHQHGCGFGANKGGETAAYDLHWQALAAKWDAALLGPSYKQTEASREGCNLWCDPRRGSQATFLRALADFAGKSEHAELATVPWCLWGHSGGGYWVSLMQTLFPQRIVAAWLRSGTAFPMWESGGTLRPQLTEAVYRIPTMLNPGIKEKASADPRAAWLGSLAMFTAYRAQGAPIGFAPDPLSGHECGDSRYLAIPFFDACLAMRLPDKSSGDQTLRPVNTGSAWLAPLLGDQAEPAAKFSGKASEAVWLPDERLARAWMEYVKTGTVGDSTPPPVPTHVTVAPRPGRLVEISWEAVADFESGLTAFIIERDSQLLAQVPEKPVGKFGRPLFQTMSFHDTPERPLPAMRYVDTTAAPGKKHEYRVIAINSVGLKSAAATASAR